MNCRTFLFSIETVFIIIIILFIDLVFYMKTLDGTTARLWPSTRLRCEATFRSKFGGPLTEGNFETDIRFLDDRNGFFFVFVFIKLVCVCVCFVRLFLHFFIML